MKRTMISRASMAFPLLVALLVVAPVAAHASVEKVTTDDSYQFVLGSPGVVPSPGIFANDRGTAGLTIKVVTPPAKGVLSAPPDGMVGGFTYTPNDGTVIEDSFTYCLHSAGTCLSNVSRVSIKFRQLAIASDFLATAVDMKLEAPEAKLILDNDDDLAVNWSLLSKPRHGQLAQPSRLGVGFVYTPDPGFQGIDMFRYCLSRLSGSAADCISQQAVVSISIGDGGITRVGGADRFAVAAEVSRRGHPTGTAPVMVASGEGYADALSAAPAAVKSGASLLLATKAALPAATAGEITRLQPMKVTVVGGPAAISDGVVAEIKRLLPVGAQVERIGGEDRFAVSRAIAKQFFGTSAHSFVTTGLNFPDALAAGAAAGSGGEPVLLVNGGADSVDAETKAALSGLATSRLAVVGGPNAVSGGMETSLKGLASVDRLMGADRYETAVSVAKAVFPTADTVYFTTGLNFPDALVGSVAAGAGHSPIYTVPGTCVPQSVLDDMARLGAQHVVLLGGERALSPAVEQLTPCD
ncbi:cell wall-binding repeat-containing protein [Herbiconiux sp. CPCC 205716]|uniref:Cell wall-binding repeat-containing protein n=1 Tax=Herbiconiux gentiana TaxID=2970912 RepID=A0ABT2GHF3_9MICO|nr:cell wall-binding repeat-containing protein [Herbiconiux gentiana]MCS5715613.1 cell wall-binding repeat-containing protein [Herbiconiux gentiana]